MIDCEHKHVMPVLNQGVVQEWCFKHGKSVNDTICLACSDRCGTMQNVPVQIGFPRRSDQEIAAVKLVCDGCPILLLASQTCKRKSVGYNPVDIYAQNPANHCPEGKW